MPVDAEQSPGTGDASASLGAYACEAPARQKHVDALLRAIPVTRMVDYGVPLGDALRVHQTVQAGGRSWDGECEALAQGYASMAIESGANGCVATAMYAWRSASALLQCAQLAFNDDTDRKRELYLAAHDALLRYANLTRDVTELRLQAQGGALYGWVVHPAARISSAVVILGGLSGWGGAYLDMGRALARRGVLAILAEGPGQGLTRMSSGLSLNLQTLAMLRVFVDHARDLGAGHVGVWGNSFGGLFAAHVAAMDHQVGAVCINGAPMKPEVPAFRTAREQMHALFGTSSEPALAAVLRAMSLDEHRHRVVGAMLVVEGGRDPLVEAGSQAAFFSLGQVGRTRLMGWEDGEHTVYNRAGERNARIADWFAEQLA